MTTSTSTGTGTGTGASTNPFEHGRYIRSLVEQWNSRSYNLTSPKYGEANKQIMRQQMSNIEDKLTALGRTWKIIGRNRTMILK